MSIWEYANPLRFMGWTGKVLPWFWALAIAALVVGLGWGFFFTPEAENFGSTVKIIYIHVPSAFIAINAWFMMVVTSIIWLVRRHHVSVLAAKAAAPVGLTMTLIALITGAIWGQPTWTTWWVWDARLTAFLVLCLFYLGYIALWAAIEDPDTAADLTSVLSLVGSVFAFLSRYAALFWATQHQDSSLSVDRAEHVSDVFYQPLLLSMAGFVLLFLALVLMRTRTEIRLRRIRAIETRGRRS